MKTLKIAHRGSSGKYPENTLLAFKKALECNVDGIELDVHMTIDGVIIVFHDHYLNFLGKKTQISKLLFAEIQTIVLPFDQKIPSLREVFDIIDKKCIINIELKGKSIAKPVTDLILEYIEFKNWTCTHFLISSFDKNNLLDVAGMDQNLPIAVLEEFDVDQAINFAKYIGAYAINPNYILLNEQNMKRMHDKGFKVFSWTVNDTVDLERMITLGVDGIISDFPERI